MKKDDVIYYKDELNDDFANIERKEKIIDKDFNYINRNFFWNILAFIAYRLIMTPIAYIYCKHKFHFKIVNRKVIKKYKETGYFLFGNHTNVPLDGYLPSMITFPKKPYVIVHPDSLALKGTEQFMKMIGAFPLPSTLEATRNFMNSMEKRVLDGDCVMVYPEAHVWPYYTKIRPFKSVSFKYPVKFSDPSFCFTVCYKKRKYSKKPKAVVYVDGPFLADANLSMKDQQEDLRNRIYETMVKRSALSDYEYIAYRKEEKND